MGAATRKNPRKGDLALFVLSRCTLDGTQSTNFPWIIGIQIKTLIAVLAAFAAR